MFAFRVPKDGSAITMISCDTVSSVFSKISSVLKAAVCSVICSFSQDSFTIHVVLVLWKQWGNPQWFILLSPMIRQIREMNHRIPKRRKTTLDPQGNITVDQYSFSFDDWSQIVPRTVNLMQKAICPIGKWPLVGASSWPVDRCESQGQWSDRRHFSPGHNSQFGKKVCKFATWSVGFFHCTAWDGISWFWWWLSKDDRVGQPNYVSLCV